MDTLKGQVYRQTTTKFPATIAVERCNIEIWLYRRVVSVYLQCFSQAEIYGGPQGTRYKLKSSCK